MKRCSLRNKSILGLHAVELKPSGPHPRAAYRSWPASPGQEEQVALGTRIKW